jgi:hypothetical protein
MRTSILIKLLFLNISLLFLFACTEKYDFDKLSKQIVYNPHVDAPLIKGSLTAADLFPEDDSIVKTSGDTIILVFRQDTLYYLDVNDFSGIPEQDTSNHLVISAVPYPVLPFDSLIIDTVENYYLTLEHGMRLDSVFTNDGYIMVEIRSSFRHTGMITIYSPDLIIDGQAFRKSFYIDRNDGTFYGKYYYPLQNAKILVNNTPEGEGYLRNFYHLVLYRSPGQGIGIDDRVEINYSVVDIDEFETAFGFAGNDSYLDDTIVATGFEGLQGVTGTFKVTDPRINITYDNSFGIPIRVDLSVLGYFSEGGNVLVDLPAGIINSSDNYLQPEESGRFQYNRNNVPNIDQLMRFPPPDSIYSQGEALANPGNSDARNFMLKTSRARIGLEVEIPLSFEANLQLRDTFKLDMKDTKAGDYVEYANLYYRIRNEFPVNIDPYLILYDSVSGVNLDTMYLAESLSEPFIKAAPVDANGITIYNQVQEYTGVIRFDSELIDNFFNAANKMIVVGSFSSYDYKNVVILSTYKFDFRFNLEAKINYQTSFE